MKKWEVSIEVWSTKKNHQILAHLKSIMMGKRVKEVLKIKIKGKTHKTVIFGLLKVKIKSIMVKDIVIMIDVHFLSQTVKAVVTALTTNQEEIQDRVPQVGAMGLMDSR